MSISSYTANSYSMYPQLQKDIKEVKANAATVENIDEQIEKSVFGSIPPVRRVMSLPEKFTNGDTITGFGLTALAVANLPEDCRDMKSSYNQVKSVFGKTTYTPSYDYKKYQHDFSFFKGTLFENWYKNTKNQKVKQTLANLYNKDVSIYESSLGQKIRNLLGITNGEMVETTMKDRFGGNAFVTEIKAGSKFAELTGRAMKRTTKLGILALGLLEVPKILKSISNGDNISQKTENTGKQIIKSGINLASITAGIAYGGAFGAKKFGAIGSLVGMGAGAVLGATASNKIQSLIS